MAVGPPLLPQCKFQMGEVVLMGNGRWIFVVLRYVVVTILVLWLLTVLGPKAC